MLACYPGIVEEKSVEEVRGGSFSFGGAPAAPGTAVVWSGAGPMVDGCWVVSDMLLAAAVPV